MHRRDFQETCTESSEMMESQGGSGEYLPEKRLSLVGDEQAAKVKKVLEEREVEGKKMMAKRVTLKGNESDPWELDV